MERQEPPFMTAEEIIERARDFDRHTGFVDESDVEITRAVRAEQLASYLRAKGRM